MRLKEVLSGQGRAEGLGLGRVMVRTILNMITEERRHYICTSPRLCMIISASRHDIGLDGDPFCDDLCDPADVL